MRLLCSLRGDGWQSLPHHQNTALSLTDYLFRDTAQHGLLDAGKAVGGDQNRIRPMINGCFADGLGRFP